ncbi:hypothetical protein BH24PSE2_BH24PSE2_06530 [soil metagenome]
MKSLHKYALPVTGEQIRVRGIVQGVGFHPTVYRLAFQNGISGEVFNDAEGVCIRVPMSWFCHADGKPTD